MNSQTPSELVRDQGSEEVFHAFGYAVPIGKDGRRLWPTKLKRMLGQRGQPYRCTFLRTRSV